jgi:redox-sensitive bicupin YhaK (pirin superfamily)
MVAGKGIVHSERTPPESRKIEHSLHALQLWLALPEADEEIDPAFYYYPAEELPTIEIDGVNIRVMMGSAYGLSSPVKTFAETLYVEAHLKAEQSLTLPMCEEMLHLYGERRDQKQWHGNRRIHHGDTERERGLHRRSDDDARSGIYWRRETEQAIHRLELRFQ